MECVHTRLGEDGLLELILRSVVFLSAIGGACPSVNPRRRAASVWTGGCVMNVSDTSITRAGLLLFAEGILHSRGCWLHEFGWI